MIIIIKIKILCIKVINDNKNYCYTYNNTYTNYNDINNNETSINNNY